MALTLQQQKFAREYLKDRNATNAAVRAGYSKKTAYAQGSRLLKTVEIQQLVQQAGEKTLKKLDVTVERVLQERARLAFYNPQNFFDAKGELKPIHQLDEDTAAALAGMDVVEMAGGAVIGGKDGIKHVPLHTKKLKFADKNASLMALEKHLGMYKDSGEGAGILNITINA